MKFRGTGNNKLDALIVLAVVAAIYCAMAFGMPAIQAALQAVTR